MLAQASPHSLLLKLNNSGWLKLAWHGMAWHGTALMRRPILSLTEICICRVLLSVFYLVILPQLVRLSLEVTWGHDDRSGLVWSRTLFLL